MNVCGEPWWNDIDCGKLNNSEKTYPSATLSTKNPTWKDQGMNPGLHSERLVTNHLSHNMALV
jgi:hypothetical protein